jgi:hypothetical protein
LSSLLLNIKSEGVGQRLALKSNNPGSALKSNNPGSIVAVVHTGTRVSSLFYNKKSLFFAQTESFNLL